MPPRRSSAPLSVDEVIGSFASRLEMVQAAPNISRYVPMPAQDVFHRTQRKHRILIGGNRGGKTYSGVADDVMILLRRHPHREHMYANRPRRIRFIGVDFDRGIDQTAIPLFSQFIPPSKLIDGSWERSYSKAEHMLRLADGSTCSFMSYEQDPNKFQAVSLDHIHFDEEPPQAIWKESMLRILDTNGSWTLSETPVQQLEWVEDELLEPVKDGVRTDIEVVELDTTKNIHLTAEALEEITKGLSAEEQLIRLKGQYIGGNLVFPEFTRRYPNVIPNDFVPRPRDGWAIYASMDYGFSHPTAWGWHAVHPDGSIVTFRLLYAPGITIDTWCTMVHTMNAEIGELIGVRNFKPVQYIGDPSIGHKNNGQTGATNQQAYALGGIPIATDGLVKMRSGDNQNIGLDKMHMYLRNRPAAAGRSATTGQVGEPWWQITESCSALIDEVRRARKPYQSLTQKERADVREGIRDKDNHAIDMSKYFFMMTHDLRPMKFRDVKGEREIDPELNDIMHASSEPVTTHQEAWDRMVSSKQSRYAGDDYFSMEG